MHFMQQLNIGCCKFRPAAGWQIGTMESVPHRARALAAAVVDPRIAPIRVRASI